VNAAAVAPDGLHIAVACKDGVLRVYALPSGGLVAGFKSYYGGLQCCAWSPDGRYVAAGGEDDMVAIYGLAERCVVAYCKGHTSWVSGVAFDSW
jgi:WD40 repeat protein